MHVKKKYILTIILDKKFKTSIIMLVNLISVMFQSFRTDRSGQTVQTQIRLLLEEQSDQGLHCLQFPLLIFWLHYYKEKPSNSTFRVTTAKFRVSEILGFLR